MGTIPAVGERRVVAGIVSVMVVVVMIVVPSMMVVVVMIAVVSMVPAVMATVVPTVVSTAMMAAAVSTAACLEFLGRESDDERRCNHHSKQFFHGYTSEDKPGKFDESAPAGPLFGDRDIGSLAYVQEARPSDLRRTRA